MYEDTAILKGDPVAQYDEYGNETVVYSTNEVFVNTRSVFQAEFYNAAQLGLNASLVLVISHRADYNGEKIVEFHGTDYDVVRADWTNGGESVSLTLAERIGNVD